MQFDDIKAAIQPNLDTDLSLIYATFKQQTGSDDLGRFLRHLNRAGMVSDELMTRLLQEGGLPLQTEAGAPARVSAPSPPPAPTGMKTATPRPTAPRTTAPEPPSPDAPAAAAEAPAPSEPAPAEPTPEASPTEAEAEPAAAPQEAPADASAASEEPGAAAPEPTADDDNAEGEASEPAAEGDSGTGGRRRRSGSDGRERRPRRTGSASGARTRKPTTPTERLRRTLRRKQGADDEGQGLPTREYTFAGKIGEGAMGKILVAHDVDLQRTVAYKVMSDEIAANPALAGKFYGEAQITAQLDHPNIVPVYALESNEGNLAYTMKLIRGKTVEKLIDEVKEGLQKVGKERRLHKDLSLNTRLELFLRVCDAMAYAHDRGVVHRDLKPENVMIGAYGEVYVMDWGIAMVREDFEGQDKVEIAGERADDGEMIIGTPQYMSPEQADGQNAALDGKSDQYAMGLILYELVSLNQAVTGKTPLKIVMRQQDAEKNPLKHAFGEKIAPELKAIINKATTKSKDGRYADLEELADDIRRFMRGEAVLARPENIVQKAGRWIGQHKALVGFVVFMVFLGLVTLSVASIIYSGVQRYLDEQRQAAVDQLVSKVNAQSNLIDGQFLKYEGLLGVINAATMEMLRRPPEDDVIVYSPAHFRGEVRVDPSDPESRLMRPPDLEKSKRYDTEISLGFPTSVIARGAKDPDRAWEDLARLAPLRRNYRNVMLRSHSEEAAGFPDARARNQLAVRGTPLSWAYVGLENGAYSAYPGISDYPSNFDHRDLPWYAQAKKRVQDARKSKSLDLGPVWGAPSVDPRGLGLILSCTMAMYDDGEAFLGVVGVDVTFDYIIEEFLEMSDVTIDEAFLLDEEGKIVVRSSKKGKEVSTGTSKRAVRMPAFYVQEVIDEIDAKRPGGQLTAELDGESKIFFYNRMHSLGWYYVVQGDEAEMLYP